MKKIFISLCLINILSTQFNISANDDKYNSPNIDTDSPQFFIQEKKLALEGNAEAQHYMGNSYYAGNNVEIDFIEAVKWYTLSANQGNAESKYYLSAMYANGLGVNVDIDKANFLLDEACKAGEFDECLQNFKYETSDQINLREMMLNEENL